MACGVGTLFVAPYIQATYTELYEVLKYKVISGGMAGTDELGGQMAIWERKNEDIILSCYSQQH